MATTHGAWLRPPADRVGDESLHRRDAAVGGGDTIQLIRWESQPTPTPAGAVALSFWPSCTASKRFSVSAMNWPDPSTLIKYSAGMPILRLRSRGVVPGAILTSWRLRPSG